MTLLQHSTPHQTFYSLVDLSFGALLKHLSNESSREMNSKTRLRNRMKYA